MTVAFSIASGKRSTASEAGLTDSPAKGSNPVTKIFMKSPRYDCSTICPQKRKIHQIIPQIRKALKQIQGFSLGFKFILLQVPHSQIPWILYPKFQMDFHQQSLNQHLFPLLLNQHGLQFLNDKQDE